MLKVIQSWLSGRRAKRKRRALAKQGRPDVGGVNHKVPPEHHNRGTGG